ncbi:MAG TPA: aldo/keto reductase [Chitinivibrionales bacterium]|nr:aldo/keto reductase [Chitinivibrionales bacterium]
MDQDKKQISRRKFLADAAALSSAPIIASCSGGSKMPLPSNIQTENPNAPVSKPAVSGDCLMTRRPLGNTGLQVSILGFGGGTKFAALSDPAGRYAALDAALAGGVNYFDTCVEYGTAATLGNYFSAASCPVSRDQVIIVDKLDARDYTGAKTSLASELALLKTSYVDILLMHNIASTDDITTFAASTGAWTYLQEAKKNGLARFIGFSSMDNTAGGGNLVTWINSTMNPDVCTLAMNITGYGNMKNTAAPAARAKGMGVSCIKTLLGVVGAAHPIAACFGGLLSLKDANGDWLVSTLIVGHDGVGFANGAAEVTANCATMNQLYPPAPCTGVLSDNNPYNYDDLERSAKSLAGPHALPWARPDFKDNGKPYIWA